MDDDDIDYAQIAEDQQFAKAYIAGEVELTYDDSAPVPELPPPDAPVRVVRPVRLPYEVDKAIRELAARRDTTPSALIRDWVVAALEESTSLDPAVELRRSLDSAQRAAAEILRTNRHRDAA